MLITEHHQQLSDLSLEMLSFRVLVTCHVFRCALFQAAERPGNEPRRVFCAIGSISLLDTSCGFE